MDLGLKQKVALVTGSSKGIGLAAVVAFLASAAPTGGSTAVRRRVP